MHKESLIVRSNGWPSDYLNRMSNRRLPACGPSDRRTVGNLLDVRGMTAGPGSRRRALVVEPNEAEGARLACLIADLGLTVTAVSSFDDACRQLQEAPPHLLVTAAHLQAYHGLHLVLRAQIQTPTVAAIVIGSDADPILEEEAANFGAAYVSHPVDPSMVAALVTRMTAPV
jgi:CheY-like chemotaxis protein